MADEPLRCLRVLRVSVASSAVKFYCALRARNSPHCLTGEIGYFTEEKLVGARNEFATRCTIGPFASVSAR